MQVTRIIHCVVLRFFGRCALKCGQAETGQDTQDSRLEVVTSEGDVGIVFENGFGGAHILYQKDLEDLLNDRRPA